MHMTLEFSDDPQCYRSGNNRQTCLMHMMLERKSSGEPLERVNLGLRFWEQGRLGREGAGQRA